MMLVKTEDDMIVEIHLNLSLSLLWIHHFYLVLISFMISKNMCISSISHLLGIVRLNVQSILNFLSICLDYSNQIFFIVLIQLTMNQLIHFINFPFPASATVHTSAAIQAAAGQFSEL